VTNGWLSRRLAACGADLGALEFVTQADGDDQMALNFEYAQPSKFFSWRGDLAARHATFEADFGSGRATLPAPVSLLSPELALSEAMFF
jgi:hypothetical protein